MNTTALAARVGVSSKTIRRWIKYFDIPCKKNEHGHYVFDEADYIFFCQIRDHVRDGVPRHEINIKPPRKGIIRTTMNTTIDNSLQQQISSLIERIELNEKTIEQKASEVVEYQLLQHRSEIDELQNRVESLESYIEKLKTENTELKNLRKEGTLVLDQPIRTPRASKKLKTIMSFLF
ncbi:MerR family transcriptional regulator [Litchfieldia salsa]|uniref:Chromosome-anchoring protein RacA n=1 Tax=Litchfieldia salsa TaxID=930152 RepID=A0A1H0U5H5_9BACI|nr:MerR family transcriptional regulator [Litchfieldia salsa]SDP61235.1 chromosome-anchoring protein RacA [Litchfieldia salsa]